MFYVPLGLVCPWSHQRYLWKWNHPAATFHQAAGSLFCIAASLTLHLAEESLRLKVNKVPVPKQMSTAKMIIQASTGSLFALVPQGKKSLGYHGELNHGIANLPTMENTKEVLLLLFVWVWFCFLKALCPWRGLFLSDPQVWILLKVQKIFTVWLKFTKEPTFWSSFFELMSLLKIAHRTWKPDKFPSSVLETPILLASLPFCI